MSANPAASHLSFDVDGMSCGHCRAAITEQVESVEGVSDVSVDLDAGQVHVSGRELAEQVVRAAITEAGYDSRLLA